MIKKEKPYLDYYSNEWDPDGDDYGYSTLIEALRRVVLYNCLDQPLRYTKNYLIHEADKGNESINRPEKYPNTDGRTQYEIFWMLLVAMFGDYGTSPRCGWVYKDNVKYACEFIDILLDVI